MRAGSMGIHALGSLQGFAVQAIRFWGSLEVIARSFCGRVYIMHVLYKRLGRYMSPFWESVRQRLKNYFVAGLLTVIPLATTIWLMVEVATRSIKFLTQIPKQVNPMQGMNPFLVSTFEISVGFVAPVLFILLIGFMARNIVGQWLLNVSEQLLNRIPVAGSVYKTLKQLLTTLFSPIGKQYRRVVLVEYPPSGGLGVGICDGGF